MSFGKDCRITADALEAFETQSRGRTGKVIHQTPMAELARQLDIDRLIAEGGLTGDRLARFLADYLANSTRLRDPRYMGHQVAVPHGSSALGALVDGFTNNAMAIYEMGPAAAAVEHKVVNWMLAKAGWQTADPPGSAGAGSQQGGGVLTHGGSLANLTALVAARGRVAPRAWMDGTPRNLVIVAARGCHYSIPRAAGILGLGETAVRLAPTDDLGRLDAARLGAFVEGLRAEGLTVMAVVANACATALGLYDPIRKVAEVCRELGVWLHVDGAHGASALVSERHRGLLDGLELADSLVWDAHKMLRTSVLSAAVLVRDGRDLDQAFHEDASYLFHDKEQLGFDFVHRTIECTKAALGLKVFMALAAEGEAALADYWDRQAELAREAARWIRSETGFELAAEPQANIVCFRVEGDDGRQLAIRKRLVEDGRYYISTTEHAGRRWLRLALMNPETSLGDVQALAAEIRRLAAAANDG